MVSAGRRWGKTYLSMACLAAVSRFPRKRVMYVAPTYAQAKTILWDDLKEHLLNRHWVRRINETELQITLVNNSRISLRSAENFDRIRGSSYDYAVLDEASDIQPDAWFKAIRPTLSDRLGGALFITTPKGRGWIYDLYMQAQALPDWRAWQFTTIQGGNVLPEEIEAARRDLDDRTFRQEYLAEFVDYAGVIFYAFSEDNMRPAPEITASTPLHIGIDFNTSPLCAVIGIRSQNSLHIIDEITIWGSNTQEMAQEIRNRYGHERQIFCYPDATGARRTTNSGGISDHIILSNAGFRVISGRVNPVVAESIADVNSLFRTADGERRLFLAPECRKLRESVLKWSYKEGTRIPDKEHGLDHHADALRYVVSALFPLRQNTPEDYAPGARTRSVGRMMG